MTFGENLKYLRAIKGLTQQQVADALDIQKATYSGYETGRREPDVSKIKALAKVFGVTGDELLGMDYGRGEPNHVTAEEWEHIKKYRRLPDTGKQAVENILDSLLSALPVSNSTAGGEKCKPFPSGAQEAGEMTPVMLSAFGGGEDMRVIPESAADRAVQKAKEIQAAEEKRKREEQAAFDRSRAYFSKHRSGKKRPD